MNEVDSDLESELINEVDSQLKDEQSSSVELIHNSNQA
jgi:hypothetical protein